MRVELTAPTWATHILSDLTDWQKGPLAVDQLQPFTIADDAYFEYAFQNAQGERKPDPANHNPGMNPWWPYASNIMGPTYRPDPLAEISGTRAAGRLLRLDYDSKLLGQTRRVLIYSPAGMAQESLPVILFQDGKAYYGWGKVPQIMDRLLERNEIEPAHLVFLPPKDRTKEYAFNDLYLDFIVVELLPYLGNRISCDGRRVAWGASLGGLLSAQLAWRHPDLFGKVVSQSGAFLFSPDMDKKNPFAGDESFPKQVLNEAPRDIQWHLDCGTMEWLAQSNRNLEAALQSREASVSLSFRNAGHNWVNWRNGIPAGLRFALS